LLPSAIVLTQASATEAAIKHSTAPSILHIATHGFFLQDLLTPAPPTGSQERSISRGQFEDFVTPGGHVENPLLRSGLALAGANVHRGGEDDGILTALEASSLHLWGTKLVVLSACDTGVGEIKNGRRIRAAPCAGLARAGRNDEPLAGE
jgi:CHAT domain-containing protein